MATRKDELELQTDALRLQSRVKIMESLAKNYNCRVEISMYTNRLGNPMWSLEILKQNFIGNSLVQVIEKAATEIILKEIKHKK